MIQKPSILLVDDEIKITQVLAAYLQKDGYETEIAHGANYILPILVITGKEIR